MLEAQFEALGFQAKETKVFLTVAELGKSTAQAIANQCEMNRSSVYGFLNTLVEKGVLLKEESGPTTYFALADLDSFARLVAREKEQIALKEKTAASLVEALKPFVGGSSYHVPKMQFFEGKAKVENMLYQYLPDWIKSCDKIGDSTLWGYQDHTFVEEYRRWHEFAWEIRSEDAEIKLYSNDPAISQQTEDNVSKRQIRKLPSDAEFASTILVRGEFVILANTRSKPHYAVMINDPVFSSNLRTVFSMLWAK